MLCTQRRSVLSEFWTAMSWQMEPAAKPRGWWEESQEEWSVVKSNQFFTEFEPKKLVSGKNWAPLAEIFRSERKSHCLQNWKRIAIKNWEYIASSWISRENPPIHLRRPHLFSPAPISSSTAIVRGGAEHWTREREAPTCRLSLLSVLATLVLILCCKGPRCFLNRLQDRQRRKQSVCTYKFQASTSEGTDMSAQFLIYWRYTGFLS